MLPVFCTAQSLKRQTLASAGGTRLVQNAGSSYFIQQTVAQQSVIGTYQVEQTQLRQGFVQPLPAIVLGGNPSILEILVYPNPFVNGVVVNVESGIEGQLTMQLFDISGRMVLTQTHEASTQLVIPLENLSQGSYFLKLTSEEQQATHQLIKL